MRACAVRSSILAAVVIATAVAPSVDAQPSAAGQPHLHEAQPEATSEAASFQARDSSGTAWLPDLTPMYAMHARRGAWQLMLHGNLFLQYLHETGDRGDQQLGSINWVMGMAHRPIGSGRLSFRGMFSAEPATIGGCGYPDLLASGERCEGEGIHDRQHPHDLLMEMALAYDAPLAGSVRWQLYGGPAGEPALGPVAFPHRISALSNPLAPIGHHWLDSTHVTFGVVSGGVYGRRWKAEASAFNGREPDEKRTDLDLAALDSYAARGWLLPTQNVAIQVSAGKLTEAEPAESGGPALDITRITASATFHAMRGGNAIWATTAAWGRNVESGRGSNAVLLETSVTLNDRDAWFGRFEVARKSAHDLALGEHDDTFSVAKVQGGYTRYFDAWRGLKAGVGGSVSAGLLGARLTPAYGSRASPGFALFATLRPAAMMMHAGHAASADHRHHFDE
jgi:hypothetical protein